MIDIFTALGTAASYALGTVTAETLGTAAFAGPALLGYYYLLPDNTTTVEENKNNAAMLKKPEELEKPGKSPIVPVPSDSSSGISVQKDSVPRSEKINLGSYGNLDINNYTRQDFKPDRSFIRAFYYIRNNRDATDEELKDFVETNLVAKIAALKKEDPIRVFHVMNYVAKADIAPYLAFSHIKEASSKSLFGGFTIKELLDVAKYSDSFLIFLGIDEANLNKLQAVINKILKKNAAFYTLNPEEQIKFIKQYSTDNTILPLFQSLLTKIQDKETIMAEVQKSLQKECNNLLVNKSTDSYTENNRKYNEFIQSLSLRSSPEVSFSDRCGVGDVLASFTQPVICVTYIQAGEKQYNFGCKDRIELSPNNYIIYMHKRNNHCELLIPKSKLKESSKPVTSPASKSASVGPTAKKEDPCKKYEENYFLKGGTRKRCGRKYIPKKSRRKGKKMM